MARFGYKGSSRGITRFGAPSALSSRERRRADRDLRRRLRSREAKAARSGAKMEQITVALPDVPFNPKNDPEFMNALLEHTLADHGLAQELRRQPEILVALPELRLGVREFDHIDRIQQLIIAVRSLDEIFDGGRYSILILPNIT